MLQYCVKCALKTCGAKIQGKIWVWKLSLIENESKVISNNVNGTLIKVLWFLERSVDQATRCRSVHALFPWWNITLTLCWEERAPLGCSPKTLQDLEHRSKYWNIWQMKLACQMGDLILNEALSRNDNASNCQKSGTKALMLGTIVNVPPSQYQDKSDSFLALQIGLRVVAKGCVKWQWPISALCRNK